LRAQSGENRAGQDELAHVAAAHNQYAAFGISHKDAIARSRRTVVEETTVLN
jgi:hypothetical protein